MKTNNGSQPDYVLRLQSYEQFSDLPLRVAGDILKRLGIRGGFMRRYALKYNPKVVVAFERNEQIIDGEMDGELCSCLFWQPIGWLTLTRAGAWRNRRPAVQCFVAPEYRGSGIGTKLVQRAITRWKLDECKIDVFPDNKGIEAFYAKAGLE